LFCSGKPLLNSEGNILSLHPDALRIGETTAQKIMEGPRFKGKFLKIPGYYYVVNSQTKEKEDVTTHIRLLANLLRYKMSKWMSSANITLQVDILLYHILPFSYIISYLGTHCQSMPNL